MIRHCWRAGRWQQALLIFITVLLSLFVLFFAAGRWYVMTSASKPLVHGVSFVPDYARSLGLKPEATFDALLGELEVRHFRLVSYWTTIEAEQGKYNFDELDWQFARAETAGADITLAIGWRQPRWPECHEPAWAAKLDETAWRSSLNAYITAVVVRYKDSPALQSYQLENEFLLENFGHCRDFSRERVQQEFELVRSLDPNHPIIMSRSNNLPLLALGVPQADQMGVSIYRRVWNETFYKGYFNYPLPSWYYASIAGLQKIFTGTDSMVHELQMEPWPPDGQAIVNTSLEEQNESMNASMFQERVAFAERTGMREIYLWGAEWWYYRKVVMNDTSLWDEAQATFHEQ